LKIQISTQIGIYFKTKSLSAESKLLLRLELRMLLDRCLLLINALAVRIVAGLLALVLHLLITVVINLLGILLVILLQLFFFL